MNKTCRRIPTRSIRATLVFMGLSASLRISACHRQGSEDLVPEPSDSEPELTDTELLDLTQRQTFRYFWDFSEPNSGAARERYHPASPGLDQNTVTTGGSGFGLMVLLAGLERGFISRTEAAIRITQVLAFFESADRFHGAWPHWLDGRTGRVIPFSPKDNGGDLVETAFLVQGLLSVYEYFKEGTDSEVRLAQTAYNLWETVEWNWYTQEQSVLYWHWSPDFGFEMNMPLRGYNETLITYILAAASPNYPIAPEVYTQGWAQSGDIRSDARVYGYPIAVHHAGNQEAGGPLFWSHYSFLGLDPRGLSDAFTNYGEVVNNHARINYQYCLENPKNFVDYGQDCWGITASYTRNLDGSLGYSAHSPTNDTGVISPTAALSSMPYTPEESLRALRYFYRNKKQLIGPAGFYDAFSPQHAFWVAEGYLAIDQGPIVIMMENYRSGMFWDLLRQNSDIERGLQRLDFRYEN